MSSYPRLVRGVFGAYKAGAEYVRLWDDIRDCEYYSYSWFEALSSALNREMCKGAPASDFKDLFNTIDANFHSGDEDIKECIDVAFVENLFWQVPADKAGGYWVLLPERLKNLYVDFHHRTPF